MPVVEIVADVWTVVVMVVLVLAVVHKAELLSTGAVHRQPVFQLPPWRSLGPRRVLIIAAFGEMAVLVTTVLQRLGGLAAAAVLLAAYASQLRRFEAGLADCGCFGLAWLDTVVDPLRRNLALLAATVAVVAAMAVAGVVDPPFTEGMAAAAVVCAATAVGFQVAHGFRVSMQRRYSA
jgi:hypothetical protein